MRTGEQGFTYLGVLFLVMLMGMGLAGAGQLWSTASQRARERDLLWVGSQYAQALRSYYRASNSVPQYPASLEDLLQDNRFPQAVRHLRRLYPDPITGSLDWGLIRSFDGRIAGVYSQSRQRPLKQAHFPPQWVEFEGLGSYADWHFVAEKAFMEGTRNGVSR
ncbi:hypothetical protein D9M70_133900 [compost metagenome]